MGLSHNIALPPSAGKPEDKMIRLMRVGRGWSRLELRVGKSSSEDVIKFWLIVNGFGETVIVDCGTKKPESLLDAIYSVLAEQSSVADFVADKNVTGGIMVLQLSDNIVVTFSQKKDVVEIRLRQTELTKLYEFIRDFHPL